LSNFSRSQRSQEADKPHRRKREKNYSCDECRKDFSRKAFLALTMHQVIHTGERPFSCDLCGKSFPWDSCLRKHQLVHSGVKAYSCDQCDRAFDRTPRYLRRHQQIHTRKRLYSYCEVCMFIFIL
uniref:C2H2-type domain-containing protein n=1 Tax=Neolamprologus brichardi TaxID=32507 RepID=A0A3Q4HU04_NEOBR